MRERERERGRESLGEVKEGLLHNLEQDSITSPHQKLNRSTLSSRTYILYYVEYKG
jgi:hypothetical protein